MSTMQFAEPQQCLSEKSIKVWLIEEVIENIITFSILFVLFYLDNRFDWKDWIGFIINVLIIISLVAAVYGFIKPFYHYKMWRYDINDEFLQLKFGVINETHQIIPMTKVQAVETKQGPLLRKYNLCNVEVKTTGSSHTIPVLPKKVAVQLRNQIAEYAKLKEVE